MKKVVILKCLVCIISFLLIISVVIMINAFVQHNRLFDAIEANDFFGAKKAIDRGACINTRKSLIYLPNLVPTNPTPLIAACKKGNQEIVDLLLENGADVNKKDNYTQQTPLLASLHGNKKNRFSLAMYLIDKGADIYVVQEGVASPFSRSLYISRDDSEQTKEESILLLDYLLHNNVETKIYMSGENALTYATHYRNLKAVNYLIDNNYFSVDSFDSDGNTALIVATKNGHEDIVQLLVNKGSDTSIADPFGKTPLEYAIEANNQNIISILTERQG